MTLSVEVQRTVRKWAPTRSDIATWAATALGRKAAGREKVCYLTAGMNSAIGTSGQTDHTTLPGF